MLRSHATIASEADGGGVRRGLHSVPHADRLFVGLPSWQSIGTSRDGVSIYNIYKDHKNKGR